VTGVYAKAYAGDARYTQLLEGVAAVACRLGHAPRIMIAKMGQDGHDRGANVIASAFADMGFDVVAGPLFQTPEETRDLALEKAVDAIGASSLAAGHKTLIPELIDALTEAARNPPRDGEGDRPKGGGGDSPPAPPVQTENPLRHQPSAGATSPSRGGNLLALAIECARQNATLGEISTALELAFGRYETSPTPVTGVYAKAYAGDARYTQLLEGVAAVARRLGHSPRIMVAKMGQDGHDRGANVIASAFADMGFDVVAGPLFQTPRETCAMALEREVDVVGASSLAAGHKTLIPELIEALREAGRSDIKVIAGGVIPPQDYDFLREAGVQAIFGPGTNLLDAAEEVLRLLGHNMPPIQEAAE
jgi:methylmalonyl-CoA mutase